MAFGSKLRELRRKKKWTQDELGKKIGIHGRHVGKYETGEVLPNTTTLIKIARLFSVSTDYLLFDRQDPHLDDLGEKELLKYFVEVSKMEGKDKDVILSLTEAYIKKRKMEAVMTE